jgi:hypothetical protein
VGDRSTAANLHPPTSPAQPIVSLSFPTPPSFPSNIPLLRRSFGYLIARKSQFALLSVFVFSTD